jgi:hypothetical protein
MHGAPQSSKPRHEQHVAGRKLREGAAKLNAVGARAARRLAEITP